MLSCSPSGRITHTEHTTYLTYIDISKTLNHLKVKISRSDNENLDGDKVSLIPLWSQAIFRQIDVYLNSINVSTSTNNAAYRAWIETFLSYSKNVKNDQITVLEHMGGTKISETTKKFCMVEALSRINTDMMQQSKYLVNGIEVKLKLYRNNDAFLFKIDESVTNPESYTTTITDISLYVRHITPSSSILLDHTKRLAQQTAIYPIDRSLIKTYQISKGMQDQTISNVFIDQLPSRMIIGLVKADNFNGNYKMNPFDFEHFNLSHLSLNVNGKQVPMRALEPNFADKQFRRCYYYLLETILGPCFDERSIGLSEADYIDGKTLFGFSIIPDGNSSHALSPRHNGNININLKFKKALPDNITVVTYSEFQNKIEIDASRTVQTDYGF